MEETLKALNGWIWEDDLLNLRFPKQKTRVWICTQLVFCRVLNLYIYIYIYVSMYSIFSMCFPQVSTSWFIWNLKETGLRVHLHTILHSLLRLDVQSEGQKPILGEKWGSGSVIFLGMELFVKWHFGILIPRHKKTSRYNRMNSYRSWW